MHYGLPCDGTTDLADVQVMVKEDKRHTLPADSLQTIQAHIYRYTPDLADDRKEANVTLSPYYLA